MGDLGMHVLHIPLRAGWFPNNVRALLSKIVTERPGRDGTMVPCETWDNAVLACEVMVPGASESFMKACQARLMREGKTALPNVA